MKITHLIGIATALGTVFLLAHTVAASATALSLHAAGVADDASLLDLLKPVYDALTGGRYAYGTVLGLIALTAVIKRYASIDWLHTDTGGSALVATGALLAALATGLASPGAVITVSLMAGAFKAGLIAAGGYAFVKNVLITPLLPHLPDWLQKVLSPILWVFDNSGKPAAVVIAESVEAGAAAVEATPATGVIGIVGAPRDIL